MAGVTYSFLWRLVYQIPNDSVPNSPVIQEGLIQSFKSFQLGPQLLKGGNMHSEFSFVEFGGGGGGGGGGSKNKHSKGRENLSHTRVGVV